LISSSQIADIGAVSAQNELFDKGLTGGRRARNQVFRASTVAGQAIERPKRNREFARLLAGISLFSTLTVDEKAALASQMQRRITSPAG
jgi:hypothetical protein